MTCLNYKLSLLSCLAAAGLACAPANSDSPIRLLGARSLGGDLGACTVDATLEQYAGTLDIAGTTSYRLAFTKQSDLQRLSTSVGSETLAGPNRNDFIANEMILEYSSTPPIAFEPESQ